MNLTKKQEISVRELYKKGMNDYGVAKVLHVSRNSLREWRGKRGISSKTNKKSLGKKEALWAFGQHKKGLTFASIARNMGVHHSTIRRLLLRHDLKYEERKRCVPNGIKDYRFNPAQKSILMGDMFGDGHISVTSNRTACYQCGHSRIQKDFVIWKYESFKPISNSLEDYSVIDEEGVERCYSRMRTWSTVELREINNLFYPNISGNKRIDAHNAELIDPQSLAVWYMGDGTRNKRLGVFIVGADNDVPGVTSVLNRKFGDIFKYKFYKKQWNITSKDSESFFNLIRPYVLPCMRYKLP